MLSNHPQAPPPSLPFCPAPPAKLQEVLMHWGLKSSPAGTAPSPYTLQTVHLNETISCPFVEAAHVLTSLTKVINLLVSWLALVNVTPYFCGAIYSVSFQEERWKPSSNCSLWGFMLFDLKMSTFVCASHSFQHFDPSSMRAGVKSGCESIIHFVSNILLDPSNQ